MLSTKKRSLYKLTALFFFCGVLFLFAYLTSSRCYEETGYLSPPKNVIRPPKLDQEQFTQSLKVVKEQLARNEYQLASSHLSTIFQQQIRTIQGMNCDLPNLQCGHEIDYCGLGCQIHHRIGCLIVSYVSRLPLIHTPDCDEWPFNNRWTDVFQPLGSSCAPGNNTFVWKWKKKVNTIPSPIVDGIPLDSKLGHLIETISPNPFLWVVGQFVKYTMKLNSTFEQKLDKWKSEIGFDNSKRPIVGIQVRLTDKIEEAKKSRHPISMYMDEVDKYFQGIESVRGLVNNSLSRRVFVASDNSSILADTGKMYPNWELIGFNSKHSETLRERRNGLFEIVRDIMVLSQADFVVCGLSSNVCRLIYEMQAADDSGQSKDGQPHARLKSLDGSYAYTLLYHSLNSRRKNMKILKVDFI